MLAIEMISEEVPPLKTSDSGLKAIAWMEEFKLSHLPIVNNQHFLGMITEEDVYALNQPEDAVGNHRLSLHRPYVREQDHAMEVVRVMHMQHLTAVAVLDKQDRYLGLITLSDVTHYFAGLSGVSEPGGLLILEVNERDYHLSQIAGIVESNDCKILSLHVSTLPDSTRMEVIIKLNRQDLRGVLATFNRYNYVVKAAYHAGNQDDLDQRFDLLMNYLNM